MLWIYDDAIVKDLSNCINPDGGASNAVKMMGEDGIMGVFAQIQEDKIKFPIIFVERNSETPLDSKRFNFTRLHKGVPAVYDPEKNNLYLEKAIPIELKYRVHVLTTNTADMDEMVRELIFRYASMYYITTEVPYESNRKIRFGIGINPDTSISRKSGNSEYISSGTLYESIFEFDCQGAVMLSYTPRHLQGLVMKDGIKIEPTTKEQSSQLDYKSKPNANSNKLDYKSKVTKG